MDRPKFPANHEVGKMYSVAFSEAMFCWEKCMMEELEGHMRDSGMSAIEIEKVSPWAIVTDSNRDRLKSCELNGPSH